MELTNEQAAEAYRRLIESRDGVTPGTHCGCEFDENDKCIIECMHHKPIREQRDRAIELLKDATLKLP